jgi:hypothetical protein
MRPLGGFAPATPGFSAFLPPLAELGRRAPPASSGLGPGIGARVASLRCPILRPVSISLRQLRRRRDRNLLRKASAIG